jgi:hypothetical protein
VFDPVSGLASAFVGAGGAILGATIPLVWNAVANRRSKYLSVRRSALLGKWKGEGKDYYVEDTSKGLAAFTAEMTFTSVGHIVKAEAMIADKPPSTKPLDELALFGMFYNDDYLQLSYHNKNLVRKQLGVVVLGLTPDGSVLRGYYSAFSPTRETIVAGTISLTKEKTN